MTESSSNKSVSGVQSYAIQFKKAESYIVKDLPGLPAEEASKFKMFAGRMPTLSDEQSLFFWLLKAKNEQPTKKLIIWLNGGPGCSSMDGLFLENGPFRVQANFTINVNPYSWNENADVLYVDQPIGTGYSFSGNSQLLSSMGEVALHFEYFFRHFRHVFPEFKNAEVYLAGESFAGQYIPYIARQFLRVNVALKENEKVNLKAMVIGNGWIDPLRQYQSSLDFSVQNDLLEGGFKRMAQKNWATCQDDFKEGGDKIKYNNCEQILQTVLTQSKQGGSTCINMYDIRLRDAGWDDGCGMAWPDGLGDLKTYLTKPEVMRAVNLDPPDNFRWVECFPGPHRSLSHDSSPPSYRLLPELLQNTTLHIFAGDKDLICNWLGLKYMVDALEWNGKKGFDDSEQLKWTVNGKERGAFYTARNLSFIYMKDTSHMAPVDQPEAALDMINRIMNISKPSPLVNSTLKKSLEGHIFAGDKKLEPKPTTVPITVNKTIPTVEVTPVANITKPIVSNASAEPLKPIPVESSSSAAYSGSFIAVLVLILAVVGGLFMRKRLRRVFASTGRKASVRPKSDTRGEWERVAKDDIEEFGDDHFE